MLFPEVDNSLSTATDQRDPDQLADKPALLPTSVRSSGSDAASINTAAASAAEGQAQLGKSIGSMPFALTPDSSGRQPSAIIGHAVAKGQPSVQQCSAAYSCLAPSVKDMMYMPPAATMYVGAPGLSEDRLPILPGLQIPPPPPPPPPPARSSSTSRNMAPQAGYKQLQMQPESQQRPARDAEVQQSLGENGQSINVLNKDARPFRSSLKAAALSSGRRQASCVSSSSSSMMSSLLSSATGKQPACCLTTKVWSGPTTVLPKSIHLRKAILLHVCKWMVVIPCM